MVYILIRQKIVAQRGCLHNFFTFVVILVKLSALKSSNFFCGKSMTLGTQKEQQVIYWDEKRRFPFANFLQLFIQGPPLTHSALLAGR